MSKTFLFSPLFAWFIAGLLKFIVNSIKAKSLAFDQIGYGGLPSTHAALVTNITMLIGLESGVNSPTFGLALTMMIIVIIDALGLRRQIGKHAEIINQMSVHLTYKIVLSEKIGHKLHEIFAGIVVGIITGYLSYSFHT